MTFTQALQKTAAAFDPDHQEKERNRYGFKRGVTVGAGSVLGFLTGDQIHEKIIYPRFREPQVRPDALKILKSGTPAEQLAMRKRVFRHHTATSVPTTLLGAAIGGYLAHRVTEKKHNKQ
jgi:uncharacterized membrane protein YfcA